MLSANSPSLHYVRYTPKVRLIWQVVALALVILIAQQSLTVSNAHNPIPYLDKVVHFVTYAVLGVFALPALPRIRPVLVIAGLGLFGGMIEIAQGMMGYGRTPDVFDALSNLSGAFMALVFWKLFTILKT